MDSIYRQQIQIPNMVTDCFGRLKTAWLLAYVQEIAGTHCALLGAGQPQREGHRLFWAVTRHRVLINRLPEAKETITLETWPCPTTRVAYPRACAAYDENGSELFRVISLWVLMDAENRSMVLPGKSGVVVDGITRGCELPSPGSLAPCGGENRETRRVNFTELDINGHMNNTQYLNWVEDLLSAGFHREHPAKEFTICYLNEAREGQQMQLTWALDESALQVDAQWQNPENPEEKHRIFTAKVSY